MFKELFSNGMRKRGLIAAAVLCVTASLSAQDGVMSVEAMNAVATEKAPVAENASVQKAPKGKVALSSMNDLIGKTILWCYNPYRDGYMPVSMSLTIEKHSTASDSIVINNFYATGYQLRGKVDLAAGTITFPFQIIAPTASPVRQFSQYTTGIARTGKVVFTLQEDGTWTTTTGWIVCNPDNGYYMRTLYEEGKDNNRIYMANGTMNWKNASGAAQTKGIVISQKDDTVSIIGLNNGRHPVNFILQSNKSAYVDSTNNYVSLANTGATSSGGTVITGSRYYFTAAGAAGANRQYEFFTDVATANNKISLTTSNYATWAFYAPLAATTTAGGYTNLTMGNFTDAEFIWNSGEFKYPAESNNVVIDNLTYEIVSKTDKTAGVRADVVVTDAYIKSRVPLGGVFYTVTELLENCFKTPGSKMTGTVYIPKTIKKSNNGAFYGTSKISKLEVEDIDAFFNIDYYPIANSNPMSATKGVYFNGELVKSYTYSDTVTTIKQFTQYNNQGLTSIGLPKNLKKLEQYSLYALENVNPLNVPQTIEYIGNRALYHANIDTFVVPASVKTIESYGLSYMTKTKKIVFQENLEVIPEYCCYYNGVMSEVVFPTNVKRFEKSSMSTTSLKKIVIPETVTFVGEQAFYNATGLEAITIGSKVDTLGSRAFYSTATSSVLKDVVVRRSTPPVTLPYTSTGAIETFNTLQYAATLYVPTGAKKNFEGVEPWKNFSNIVETDVDALGAELTQGDLTYTVTSNTLMTASVKAANTTLTTADIASEITYNNYKYTVNQIADNGFANCSKLTTINVPASIIQSGATPFEGCTALNKVNAADVASYAAIAFADSTSNPLYYAKNLYVNNAAATTLTLPEDLTVVKPFAFYGAENVTNLASAGKLTSIGDFAFAKTGIVNLTFIDTLATIGNGAFAYLPNLETVEIAGPVKKIGNNMFQYSPKLKNITFNEEVTEIGTGAFFGCESIIYVDLPVYAKTIGESAFAYCPNIEEITISVDCSSIGKYAFYSPGTTTKIKNVTVKAKTPPTCVAESADTYNTFNEAVYKAATLTVSTGYKATYQEVLPWKNFTTIKEANLSDVEDKVFTVGNYTYTLLSSAERTVTVGAANLTLTTANDIPEEVTNADFGRTYSVVGFTANGFKDCAALTEITVPASIKIAGATAFQNCTAIKKVNVVDLASWSQINFPSSLANPMFYSQNLYVDGKIVRNLVIPEGVTTIGTYTFTGNKSIMELSLPEGLEKVGNYAFQNCSSLMVAEFPDNLKTIGTYAFANCGFTELSFPDNVMLNDDSFRENASLVKVKLPKNLDHLNFALFFSCTNLREIEFGDSLKYTNQSALCNTALTKAWLPETVDSIGIYTFYRSEKMTEVEISENVKAIGVCAFNQLLNPIITKVTCKAIVPPHPYTTSYGSGQWFATAVYSNATLYVPLGTKDAYSKAEEWKLFKKIEEVDFAGVGSIENDDITFRVENGNIILSNEANLKVYTVDGKILYNGTTMTYQLGAKGVYVIVIEGKAHKIAF